MFWMMFRCPCCHRPCRPRRRMNTAYHDDAKNWTYLCDDAYADAYEYYAERWAEYYGSR